MAAQPDERRVGSSWAMVAVAVAAIAAGLVLSTALAAARSSALGAIVSAAVLMVPLWACFGQLRTRDPGLYAAIAVPLVGCAIGTAVLGIAGVGAAATVAFTLGGVWCLGWLLAGGTLDDIRRRLLRLPPDPDRAFTRAWRGVRQALDAGATPREVHALVDAMDDGATRRMRPLINTWYAFLAAALVPDPKRRALRIWDRQAELISWYNATPAEALGPLPNPDRPTEGSRLELLFPELEALLAVANSDERLAMADLAAATACRRAGLERTAVEIALAEAPSDRRLDEVEALLEASATTDAIDEGELRYRRQLASAAVRDARDARTGADGLADAAEALYSAGRACDGETLEALDHQLRSILPPERLAQAREVTVDRRVVTEFRQPRQRLIPWSMPIAMVAWIGFLAGAGGTVIRAATWPFYQDRLSAAEAIAPVVGIVCTFVLCWGLLRGFGHRLIPTNAVDLLLASVVATVLAGLLMTPTSTIVRTVAPAFWESVFAHRVSVMPYAPLFGLAMAAVLVGIAVVTRRDAR